MGNAIITEPRGGSRIQNLANYSLAKCPLLRGRGGEHKGRLPVGAIAGGIVGSIVFVFFIAATFLLRR